VSDPAAARADSPAHTLAQRLLAEGLGTMGLLAAVIGSGVMAERLAGGNAAIALLANTLATVGALIVLIEVFGPVSGAHFNPAVSAVMALRGALNVRELASYIVVQLLGAMLGAWLVHLMFDLSVLQWSTRARDGWPLLLAEVVATGGLLLVILRAPAGPPPGRSQRGPAPPGGSERSEHGGTIPASVLVAAYIGAAYWFTASTSFANPAAAFGRMFSDTFAGIAPASVTGFVLAQAVGAALAVVAARALDAR
jgi:glycerol uptake facilitator-like aquaporin